MSAFLLKHQLPAPTCLSIPVATAAESDKQRGSPDGIGRSILPHFIAAIHKWNTHWRVTFKRELLQWLQRWFHAHQCMEWHCHLLLNQFNRAFTIDGTWQKWPWFQSNQETLQLCQTFYFNQVPASFCGLYSRYRSWCITKNVQSCGMPLMYIVIYPEYVTRTKAIVHCCIFSVLTGLWYRWDIVWYRI